ncbi:hypothetical protein BV25DRAFT_1807596, partial [Artomyces pyxidatus]
FTADNTGNNDTTCDVVSRIIRRRNLDDDWDALQSQFPCLSHVINLAICDFMAYITKIAVIETKQAIWDYDPSIADNRIFGRDLDVIAVIRTLAVKVSCPPRSSTIAR